MLSWIGLVSIAIINGIIRDTKYRKLMNELQAHQISTLIFILLSGVYIWTLSLRLRMESSSQAITIGLIWIVMTIAFEFLFGHYVAKRSWSRLLQEYNIFKGRVWILVLLWAGIAPYLFYKLSS